MKKIKIAIIFGGNSSEYGVSLQSAYSVISQLAEEKYERILIGITKDGVWNRYYGSPEKILNDQWMEEKCVPAIISPSRDVHGIIEYTENGIKETYIDVAFPVLHGKYGEDGTVQGLIELAGIPLVGCDTLSSALCMDKQKSHKLVEMEGIKTAKSLVFDTEKTEEEIVLGVRSLQYPVFVKPLRAGSSFGITKVLEEESLLEAVRVAYEYDSQIIIEEEINGFEVGCAVLGNHKLIVGEVDEIELEKGFFDFTEKYTLKSSKIHMPARIPMDYAIRIKQTAVKIYEILGCKGFSRVDMFLKEDGEIVFNEVNTIPGFTSHSRYPNMLKGIGYSFEDIIDELVRLAMES